MRKRERRVSSRHAPSSSPRYCRDRSRRYQQTATPSGVVAGMPVGRAALP
jgi:hypothetical protein